MQQLDFFNTLEQTKPICPICGNVFEKANPKKVYCSNKCYKKFHYEANKEKIKERKKAYYRAHKVEKKEYSKAYREKNKEYLKAYSKAYSKAYEKANKEKIKERKKAYYRANKERFKVRRNLYIQKMEIYDKTYSKAYSKAYREKNKEKLNEKIRKYSKNRWKTNTNFKLKKILSSRINYALKRRNKSVGKSKNTIELLGCSIIEARKHLEKQFKEGMTWDNHGYDGWHIDHIIPCASFDLTDPEQQKKCFHYTNLQPLWAEENLSKGAKIF